jgi:hypothetical protein
VPRRDGQADFEPYLATAKLRGGGRTVLDEAALGIGRQIVKQAVRAWLGVRRAEAERGAELVDLVATSVTDAFHRRRLVRQLEDIGDHAASRLKPLYEQEFRGLPENERQAALVTLVDTLAAADLSDRALFDADTDPIKLARAVRDRVPKAAERALLGEAATALYEAALDESCMALVRIVQQLPAFQPRATTELLNRTSQLADQVGEVLVRLPRTTLDAPSGRQHDHEFRQRYQNLVSERLDELELFGVDVRRYQLRTRLTVAYLSLSVTGDGVAHRRRRHLPDDRWFTDRRETGESTSVRVEAALADRSRTLLRGEAGSGKTTLLQWLAVNSARGGFTGGLTGWNGRTAFLVRLRRYPDGSLPRPEQFIDEVAGTLVGLMPEGWVHRQLEESALLLVDGVDELAPRQRPKVRRWLRELATSYPALPIVVTSRPSAAGQSWIADLGFDSVLLEPMGPADVAAFCARWHEAVREAGRQDPSAMPCSEDELNSYETTLARHLDSRRPLRTLASNPLLCAMLCALNLDRRKQLPPDRMGLYDAALKLLVERRDIEREVPAAKDIQLDTRSKVTLLQRLAWDLTSLNRVELSLTDTEELVEATLARLPNVTADARDVTQFLLDRSGVIRKPAEGRVDFIHRTFQEYLAAKYATDDHQIKVLVHHAHSDQWRETIVMAAGHANDKQRETLLTAILDRADTEPSRARSLRLLAAACMETAHTIDPDTTARIDGALGEIMPPRSRRESRSLSIGGDRALRNLPTSLEGLSEPVAAACVRTAALVNGQAALSLLSRYAKDSRRKVQEELAEVWRYFDAEEYATTVLADSPLHNGWIEVRRSEHLRHVWRLNRLTQLYVEILDEKLDDLVLLDGVPHLRFLNLTMRRDVNLEMLANHQAIRTVYLDAPGVTSGFATLAKLRQLEYLSLRLHNVDSISFVAPLTELTYLNLSEMREVDDLRPLTGLRKLQWLILGELETDPCAVVDKMRGLARLCLRNVPLRSGLARLQRVLPRLTWLSIGQCPELTTVDQLSAAEQLQDLAIWDSPIDDVSALAGLPRLEIVDFDGTNVTDVRPLASLPKLRRISLCNCPPELDLGPLSELSRRAEVRLLRGQEVRGLDLARKRVRIKWV